MTDLKDSGSPAPNGGPWRNFFRRMNLRPYLTGIVPLFVIAHLGHHGVGAMLQPLMPMIRTELGLSYTSAGFLTSAFTLTNGLSQLPAGWLADKVGARVMVLLGVTGVAIAGFLIGFANSYVMLMVLLIISALLGGGYHPSSVAAISSGVKTQYRGRSLGIHLIGGTSAFWLLPLLITPIISIWDWRMAFKTLTIPIAILGVILFILIGKEVRAVAKKREAGIEDDPEAPQRVNWGQMIPFVALSVLAGTMIQSTMGYLSFYATDVLNIPETRVPLLMAITPITGLVVAPVGGYLADRFGSIRVLVIISFAAIPMLYLLGLAPNVITLAALMVVMGMIMNTRMPTSESYIAGHTPVNRRSTMLGIYFFAGTGVAGPLAPVIGNLIDRKGFQWTFTLASAIVAGIVVICSYFLWRNRRYDKYPEITGQE